MSLALAAGSETTTTGMPAVMQAMDTIVELMDKVWTLMTSNRDGGRSSDSGGRGRILRYPQCHPGLNPEEGTPPPYSP